MKNWAPGAILLVQKTDGRERGSVDDNCIKMVDDNCIQMTGDDCIDDVDEFEIVALAETFGKCIDRIFEMPLFGSVFSNWLSQALHVVGQMY